MHPLHYQGYGSFFFITGTTNQETFLKPGVFTEGPKKI